MSTYYVDFAVGDDANNGTSTSTPWKHHPADANATGTADATGLSPDDVCVFKGGVVYRGEIYPGDAGWDGTSGHEIILRSGHLLGTPWGSTPAVISGAPLLSGWSDEGGNVWSIALTTQPQAVSFQELGLNTWGVNNGTPAAKYDWYWSANRLYVYATTSPDVHFTHVNAHLATRGVELYENDYWTVDGLEIAYQYYYAARLRDSDGITIQNCHLHHVGVRDTQTNPVIGISSNARSFGTLVMKDSEIHDGGRHAISVSAGGAYVLSGITIQDCEIYNGFHNNIDIQASSTSQVNSVVIQRNLIHATDAGPAAANGIFSLEYDTAQFNDWIIRNNMIHSVSGSGITLRNVDTCDILNNTIVNVQGMAIKIGPNNAAFRVLNNILVDSHTSYYSLLSIDDSTDISECDYNDLYQSGDADSTYLVDVDAAFYTTIAAYQAGTTFGDNSISADPGFTAKPTTYGAAVDFSFAGDQACVDAGLDLEVADGFTDDYFGTARPTGAWDIGAFEYEAPATYAVTYDGNGEDSGSVPVDGSSPYEEAATVTALGNTGTLAKTGYTFSGWNTAANGTGTAYDPDDEFAMPAAAVTLYAQWTPVYAVTYDGNGEDSGSVPTDASSPYLEGATVTVAGNTGSLVKDGYVFSRWNTQADGLGTSYLFGATFGMPGSGVTLYAQWTAASAAEVARALNRRRGLAAMTSLIR